MGNDFSNQDTIKDVLKDQKLFEEKKNDLLKNVRTNEEGVVQSLLSGLQLVLKDTSFDHPAKMRAVLTLRELVASNAPEFFAEFLNSNSLELLKEIYVEDDGIYQQDLKDLIHDCLLIWATKYKGASDERQRFSTLINQIKETCHFPSYYKLLVEEEADQYLETQFSDGHSDEPENVEALTSNEKEIEPIIVTQEPPNPETIKTVNNYLSGMYSRVTHVVQSRMSLFQSDDIILGKIISRDVSSMDKSTTAPQSDSKQKQKKLVTIQENESDESSSSCDSSEQQQSEEIDQTNKAPQQDGGSGLFSVEEATSRYRKKDSKFIVDSSWEDDPEEQIVINKMRADHEQGINYVFYYSATHLEDLPDGAMYFNADKKVLQELEVIKKKAVELYKANRKLQFQLKEETEKCNAYQEVIRVQELQLRDELEDVSETVLEDLEKKLVITNNMLIDEQFKNTKLQRRLDELESTEKNYNELKDEHQKMQQDFEVERKQYMQQIRQLQDKSKIHDKQRKTLVLENKSLALQVETFAKLATDQMIENEREEEDQNEVVDREIM